MKEKPAPSNSSPATALPAGYATWLADIKSRVQTARSRAALAANAELVGLYWHIGNDILQRQQTATWGEKVLQRLSSDLREAFPEMKGFSSRNLKYMRFFAEHCPQQAFGQQPAAQLPWFHIVVLLTKVPEAQARGWYAEQAVAQGWSRTTLELQVRNRLHERQGRAVTNFAARLPQPGSDLAHETLKDPYLSGIDKPMGVAEYQLVRALPDSLANSLPTVEELESELGGLEQQDQGGEA